AREYARQHPKVVEVGPVDEPPQYPDDLEYSFWVDCNCNGYQDVFDIMDRRSRDENNDGTPDECEKRHDSAEMEVGPKGCLQLSRISAPIGGSQAVHVLVRGPLSLKVRLYDEAGQLVRTVLEDKGEGRPRDIPLESKTLKPGYYFVRALESTGDSLQF